MMIPILSVLIKTDFCEMSFKKKRDVKYFAIYSEKFHLKKIRRGISYITFFLGKSGSFNQ